jgi:hypothetical protein
MAIFTEVMMKSIPIEVQCHSGYRADEYPICFYWNHERYDILEIMDRWYQGELNPEWPVSNYFKVNTTRGGPCIIRHVITTDDWFLCR